MQFAGAIAGILGIASGVKSLMTSTRPPDMPSYDLTAQERALAGEAANRRQRGFASTILGRDFLSPGSGALKGTLGV